MSVVLFRVDGSSHLGLGHVMRCLAFAQGLEGIGVGAVFVVRDYARDVAEIIRQHGHAVQTIPGDCSFREDASLTLRFADQRKINLLVTDLSNTDIMADLSKYGEYLREMKGGGKFLVTIDDINEIAFPSDIMVNPNYGAERMNYNLNGATRFLLGPCYFIFRQEFMDTAAANREIKKEARNILVAVAGSDPLNLTEKVVRALSKLENISSLNVRVVLGIDQYNSARHGLEERLGNLGGNCELLGRSENMAELMLWSDLAITGGGLTKYETAITGTPSIVISQAAHHVKIVEEFEKEQTILHLGLNSRVSEEDVAGATARLLRDYALRAEMSKRGKALVDGRGIERIISEIPGEVLTS